jgi:hypothetical protein
VRFARRRCLLRLAVVVGLALVASGVPSVILAAEAGADADCSSGCDTLPGGDCPPNCSSGPCARIVPSLASVAFEVPAHASEPTRVGEGVPERLASGVVRGVFRPPRA